ncbi:thioredoxin family protein [Flavobacterium sp. 20NA77.7]|uniref:Thioredoxin family protein n=1 Tax=Flavobacterium nakdongensis TaxID=3073563 RepID=A0ABY9R9Q1_9FLAO|nr:thioredoxin family protein [Flavobacterium sp. 20NA77.7]WMW77976.1 thioredoxin family protein [Flavobacterium sp. 20NA77.7]
MKKEIEQSLLHSFTYPEYRAHIAQLLTEGMATGHEQNADLVHYSELNQARMHRLDKTIQVLPEVVDFFSKLTIKQLWVVLAEGWCGDAANCIPVLHKIAEGTSLIDMKIILRDDNDAVMQHFLTNGARAIPKLLILDAETLNVIANWGPRPEPAKQLILDYKATYGIVDETAKIELQKWYLQDKGIAIQNEILKIYEQIHV